METDSLTNYKITQEDWALTPPVVRQTLLDVVKRLDVLEEEVSRLRSENEQLREQTRRSSRNNSQPPSSAAPSAPPREKRQSSGKQRGAQPGHEGRQRKLYRVTVKQGGPSGCVLVTVPLALAR